ncbi:MAG: hypothetical protein NTW00_04625, partial [Hyphomicrobiales bacterium]|nr:hypothetical protein [Hyphomicrobiales bacterium]
LDASNHGKFAQLAAIAPQLRSVLAQGIAPDQRAGNAGEVASGSLEALVKLPIAIIGAPLRVLSGR